MTGGVRRDDDRVVVAVVVVVAESLSIEGEVRAVRQDLRDDTYGDITAAATACVELEEALGLTLDLTPDERARLVHEETVITRDDAPGAAADEGLRAWRRRASLAANRRQIAEAERELGEYDD
jgi:hypothetical protein